MNIALIGPSGAGKGTHTDELTERFGLIHLSTGDLLRRNLENRTALGILARKYMAAGELVPDEVVDAMIEEWVRKTAPEKRLFFDGFPRTIYQARFLDELFNELGRSLDAVIYLKVPDQEIVERLSGRLICHSCDRPFHRQHCPPRQSDLCNTCGGELYRRPDDTPNMVRTRLKVFHRVTDEVVDYFHSSGRLMVVDGCGELAQVSDRLFQAMDAVMRREIQTATAEEADQIRSLKPRATLTVQEETTPGLGLILLGAPGSGKGTQAVRLADYFKIPHIATGDLFRTNLKRGTPLGKLAQSYMNRGELVPDNITESMVQERLARVDTLDGFLLDGFPRTLAQATALAEMTATLRRRLAGVIYLRVPDESIVERLSGRLICRQCQAPYHRHFKPPTIDGVCDLCGGSLYQREDDNAATVQARLRTFHAQTAPLIDFYRRENFLTEVDADADVTEVTARSLAAVEELTEGHNLMCAGG